MHSKITASCSNTSGVQRLGTISYHCQLSSTVSLLSVVQVFHLQLTAASSFKLKAMTESERTAVRALVTSALAWFEARYPTFDLDHKLHQIMHLLEELPCHWYSEWSLERGLYFILAHINNQNRKGASAAARLACSMAIVMYQCGLPEAKRFGLDLPLLRALAFSRPYDAVLRFSPTR